MWIRTPKFSVKPNLPLIARHDQLSPGAVELARIQDNTHERHLWLFVKNNGWLSILLVSTWLSNDGQPQYLCGQDDFPMEFLAWLPNALTEFQRPPAEGGLPPGAMVSNDQNVNGEILNIKRAMGLDKGHGGYTISNLSRSRKTYDWEAEYSPHEVSWAQRFLLEGGLLDLIKDLADKYKNGAI